MPRPRKPERSAPRKPTPSRRDETRAPERGSAKQAAAAPREADETGAPPAAQARPPETDASESPTPGTSADDGGATVDAGAPAEARPPATDASESPTPNERKDDTGSTVEAGAPVEPVAPAREGTEAREAASASPPTQAGGLGESSVQEVEAAEAVADAVSVEAAILEREALASATIPGPAAELEDMLDRSGTEGQALQDMSQETALPVEPASPLGDFDYHLFGEGTHLRLWERMGAQLVAGGEGAHFSVWAPNARAVSVIGEWNAWDPARDPLHATRGGVWTGLVPTARRGMLYKFRVVGASGEAYDKADPYALMSEAPPATASVVWDHAYDWGDASWLARRAERQGPAAPMAIYEVHLGSWLRGPGGEHLSYRAIAPKLIAHVRALGFTHVELMPLTEHPFYGSWGYQATGYFAPTRRYGEPQELMALIDALHQANIGVILDWVPAHFPNDGHGLVHFDGTHLYEHADPRRGVHPDWNTMIFNLARHEVRSFLLSSALMWLQAFHVDGLRVDAVASMLYLDYSRKEGQWLPNHLGGRENLEAIEFLRALNQAIHREVPGAIVIAEESTAWPGVSHKVEDGGLGFDFKWDMGWMHDTLRYFGRDPVTRSHHHRDVTFRMMYAYSERFMLPLSHDEVVHGKGSLVRKMSPGTGGASARLANLRLLYAYMFGLPGKKLLFMGDEFAQVREWNHDGQLDWGLLAEAEHAGLMKWVGRLGHLLRAEPALYELDHDPIGFRWAVVDDYKRSTLAFLRRPRHGAVILVILNFTPMTWTNYTVPFEAPGEWIRMLSSDEAQFGGAGHDGPERLIADHSAGGALPCAATLDLPPLTALVYRGPEVKAYDAAALELREALAAEAEAARKDAPAS
ncbi:glycogen branching enzyme [Nannocystis exedens]|uniref:1,4-alpha-glucan branching enzyme GlgB n=1 Tax=Nannocystis exedens TaxID=54 RepID=A0A1I1ZC34_9BACT|nr:1,4-alpha-glucan branching protein GlgB [Nannocystis exedens]PCC75049.1 glycogen-branching enzyme [Nannocystis exedens]SFE29259.1 glycogen branching enzyme [Nannocystis exedens]